MKKRIIQSSIVLLMLLGMQNVAGETIVIHYNDTAFAGACTITVDMEEVKIDENPVIVVAEPEVPDIESSDLYFHYVNMGYSDEEFYDDLELLAEITLAEAGNQSALGKRLVIDTVLNRIDSDAWRDDDTIREVVTHPYQYESYTNGAYTRQEMNEDIARLVEEELLHRTNYEVIFFRTNYWFDWAPKATNSETGEPLYEGDHYFSTDIERW